MSTTPAADGEAMAAAREAGGWAALLFLAADLDRKADETAAESAAHDAREDRDASFVAYGASGAWRAAASMARVRAHAGSGGDSRAVPVSPDGREAQGGSVDPGDAHEALAAALPEEWVKAAEGWYSMHGSGLVRNLLAGAVPLIRAAERERNAAEVEALAAEFTKPDASASLSANLAQRTAFPAIREALTGAAELIRKGTDG